MPCCCAVHTPTCLLPGTGTAPQNTQPRWTKTGHPTEVSTRQQRTSCFAPNKRRGSSLGNSVVYKELGVGISWTHLSKNTIISWEEEAKKIEKPTKQTHTKSPTINPQNLNNGTGLVSFRALAQKHITCTSWVTALTACKVSASYRYSVSQSAVS